MTITKKLDNSVELAAFKVLKKEVKRKYDLYFDDATTITGCFGLGNEEWLEANMDLMDQILIESNDPAEELVKTLESFKTLEEVLVAVRFMAKKRAALELHNSLQEVAKEVLMQRLRERFSL